MRSNSQAQVRRANKRTPPTSDATNSKNWRWLLTPTVPSVRRSAGGASGTRTMLRPETHHHSRPKGNSCMRTGGEVSFQFSRERSCRNRHSLECESGKRPAGGQPSMLGSDSSSSPRAAARPSPLVTRGKAVDSTGRTWQRSGRSRTSVLTGAVGGPARVCARKRRQLCSVL